MAAETTTSSEDGKFGLMALTASIEWIGENLTPRQVFDTDKLEEWARKNSCPEDCFDEDKLGKWAEENGYTKSEE